MSWRELWRGIRGGGFGARELEKEVARLRGENRALMNSILGIAGVPPVIVADASEADAFRLKVGEAGVKPGVGAAGKPLSLAVNAAVAAAEAKNAARLKNVAPMRRRSWHQVNRMLEIDAARKKEQVVAGEDQEAVCR